MAWTYIIVIISLKKKETNYWEKSNRSSKRKYELNKN